MAYGSPEQLVGAVLDGTYQLERVVGEGAFGAVYAARHLRLKRPVAVKILRAVDADAFARFRREAEITSSLGSRYIAQVFDFNEMPSGEPYLVMELLAGEDLATRLARASVVEQHRRRHPTPMLADSIGRRCRPGISCYPRASRC